ncbi:MAG: GntR family transcriptional regulator [Rhizobacter sp.]|nr:GntR family transcriptional regulator [Rhizobacter sp.]
MKDTQRAAGHLSITVNDVAKVAGVSAMTVSRVLNRPETVPPATVAKVRAAVLETGYVPNRMAGALRSSKSRLVAAVVPTLSGPIFLETIQALTTGLAERGYHLMVGQSGYSEAREDELLSDIISRRPDGIVLTGVLHTAQGRTRLLASGIPVIETWDLAPDPIDMLIGFSHEGVGRAVGEYLRAKGRRKLAAIGGDDVRSHRRSAAFAEACRDGGQPTPLIHFVPAPTRLGDGRRALSQLLEQQPDIDGLFCSSDLLALGVLTEAHSRGIAVPERFAVVGFGDLNFAADLHPALTSVRIDGQRIGELAAQFIVARANGEVVAERVVDIGFSIVERSSS